MASLAHRSRNIPRHPSSAAGPVHEAELNYREVLHCLPTAINASLGNPDRSAKTNFGRAKARIL